VPQPIVKPTVIEPIVVPQTDTARVPQAEVVAEASAPAPAPAADVPEASTPADAAAFASSDVDDAATLAAGGDENEATPGELMGNQPSQIESEGDARNSPMV
jgi:hypothetical protein